MKNLICLATTFGFSIMLLNAHSCPRDPPIKLLYPDKIYPVVIPSTGESLHRIINLASKKHGVSPLLIEALIKIESDFNPNAFKVEPSHKGASIGLMQVMSFNATPSPCNLNNPSDLFTPSKNVDCGTALLRVAINRTNRLKDALIAYNGGFGCLTSKKCLPQGTVHANKVMKILAKSIIQNSK